MKWVLVFLVIKANPNYYVEAVVVDEPFDSMIECFEVRSILLAEVGGAEYFPPNTQAVCIRTED